MKYVFGPVFSRRLGLSLGIDPIPMKTCNWNCVYCQLGRTVPLTNERKDYFPPQEILQELRKVLSAKPAPQIDWISIVGSGEPLLMASLGWLIHEIKKLTSIPVALITNGSLFYLPEVRREVLEADVVMPSVDAGSPEIYKKINRPHPQITFTRFVDGLVSLRQEYCGRLWPEVMLLKGMNDNEQAIKDIAQVLKKIQPDLVYINTPVRPPAEMAVGSPDEQTLQDAVKLIGQAATIAYPVSNAHSARHDKIAVADIIDMVCRHPLSEKELDELLTTNTPDKKKQVLGDLRKNKLVKIVKRNGVGFWCCAAANFPE